MKDEKSAYYAVIPGDVRYDPELPPNAKLLYGELTSLCGRSGYCWATNSYFAELYGLSESTISRMVRKLEQRGYIRCEMAPTATGSERRIYAGLFVVREGGVGKNAHTPLRKNAEGGVGENAERGVGKNADQNNKQLSNTHDIPPNPPTEDAAPTKPGKSSPKYRPDWFERFWQLYPPIEGQRKGRQEAARAWDKVKPDFATAKAMAIAIAAQKRTPQWQRENGRYIPRASTWLRNSRWKDEIVAPTDPPPDSGGWANDPEVMT